MQRERHLRGPSDVHVRRIRRQDVAVVPRLHLVLVERVLDDATDCDVVVERRLVGQAAERADLGVVVDLGFLAVLRVGVVLLAECTRLPDSPDLKNAILLAQIWHKYRNKNIHIHGKLFRAGIE